MRHRMNLESVATYEGAHVSHALINVLAIAGIPAFRQLAEGTATHGFVTGYDLSRAAKANPINGLSPCGSTFTTRPTLSENHRMTVVFPRSARLLDHCNPATTVLNSSSIEAGGPYDPTHK